jgi:hypothetical protein
LNFSPNFNLNRLSDEDWFIRIKLSCLISPKIELILQFHRKTCKTNKRSADDDGENDSTQFLLIKDQNQIFQQLNLCACLHIDYTAIIDSIKSHWKNLILSSHRIRRKFMRERVKFIRKIFSSLHHVHTVAATADQGWNHYVNNENYIWFFSKGNSRNISQVLFDFILMCVFCVILLVFSFLHAIFIKII